MILQRIQGNINDYFNEIHAQLKEIEKDVLLQIRSSAKLKNLSDIIDKLQVHLDEEQLKQLNSEKLLLEEKVDRARFGFVVNKKDYYQTLIEEMQGFSTTL